MLELQTSGCYDIYGQIQYMHDSCDYHGRFMIIQVGKTIFGRGHLLKQDISLEDIAPEERALVGIYIDLQAVIPVIRDFKQVCFDGKIWFQPKLGDFRIPPVKAIGAFNTANETASIRFKSNNISGELNLCNWFFFQDIVKNEIWSDFLGYQISISKPWCALVSHNRLKSPLETFFARSHVDKNVFVMMRFQKTDQQNEIREVLVSVLNEYGLTAQIADTLTLTDELWDNVCTYMLGCKFGIAVFEQIEERSFNPNVAIELGFMQALQKKVLVLKDRRIPRLPTDLCGRIYREFDSYKIKDTLTYQIKAWIEELRALGEIYS